MTYSWWSLQYTRKTLKMLLSTQSKKVQRNYNRNVEVLLAITRTKQPDLKCQLHNNHPRPLQALSVHWGPCVGFLNAGTPYWIINTKNIHTSIEKPSLSFVLKKKAESGIKNKFMKDRDTSDWLRALRLLLSTVRSLSLSGVGSDLSYLEIIPWRVT